jgi:hypothetical protein
MIRLSLTTEEFETIIGDLATLQTFRRQSMKVLAGKRTDVADLGRAQMTRTQGVLERLNEQLAMQRDDMTVVVPNFVP